MRPSITASRTGKIFAFLLLFLLPLICLGMGTSYHIERSKETTFCLSCHEMEPYGKSLLVDDPGHLPAAHFQNHRVPADVACYTCHTNYAMFGGLRAKMHGLRHVYIHYLSTPQAPENIKLYDAYNNRIASACIVILARDPSRKGRYTLLIRICRPLLNPTRFRAFQADAMTWFTASPRWTTRNSGKAARHSED